MKQAALLFSCALLFSFSLNTTFQFIDNKTQDGHLDPVFLQQMIQTFGISVFIETGTYNGKTAERAAKCFKQVHTIELSPSMYEEARDRLASLSNVSMYLGNSSEMIPAIAAQIHETALFWLDAHYCGEKTAMSEPNPNNAEAITAIRKELAAIKESGITNCVLLIDDIRGYGSRINGIDYCGCWAYPPVQEVCSAAREINLNFEFALLGDSLLAYDASNCNPQFSSVVEACTKSRLYDGTNLSDAQLLEAEQTIRNAQSSERSFIHQLYSRMTGYNDPLFHHDLWYGLTCLSTNKKEAEKALLKVPNRNQQFDNKRTIVNKLISYEHPRIYEYIAEAQS